MLRSIVLFPGFSSSFVAEKGLYFLEPVSFEFIIESPIDVGPNPSSPLPLPS